ncbi:MAG TPA: DUF3667 domain-containing protein [Planctomycetota bacterium]|nr:DUF3667 domain-containing protein [Planctomycetota bacterium]
MKQKQLCVNCGAKSLGRFCPACGERRIEPGDLAFKKMFAEWLDASFHLNGKLLVTARKLLLSPGFLTKEWIAGRRTRYSKPFAIFLVVNVIFFLIQPHTHVLGYGLAGYVDQSMPRNALRRELVAEHVQASGEDPKAFAARFETKLMAQKKSLFLVMIPMIGGVLGLLHWRRRRTYVEHLVFSIHLFAFFLIALAVIVMPGFLLLKLALPHMGSAASVVNALFEGEWPLVIILSGFLGFYLFRAQRLVYGDSRIGAAWRSLAVVVSVISLIVAFSQIVFYTTLWML